MRMLLSYLSKKVAMCKAKFHSDLIFGLILLICVELNPYGYGVHFNLHIYLNVLFFFFSFFFLTTYLLPRDN